MKYTYLIGARIRDVDDACSQFGPKVVNEGRLEHLCLCHNVFLIETARHGEQQAELTLTLQT